MNIATKSFRDGFSMPVFGLGTWRIGGSMERDPSNDGEQDCRSIQRAIERGVYHIDTAEIYADGYAEEIVGRAIRGVDREKLFLVSKVWSSNLEAPNVIRAAEESLKRLGTEYLDLYLVHKPNAEIPLASTMGAMNLLAERGLIRNIGVSNFTTERMMEAQKFSSAPIVATQVHYNLQVREAEREGVLKYSQEMNSALIAWRPLQKGLLGDEHSPTVEAMQRKYNKSAAQIAINWLISQEGVVTLSTMRTEKHLDENLGALGWTMDSEDIERIRGAFEHQASTSDVIPLQ